MHNFKRISAATALSLCLISNVSAAKKKNDIKIEIDGKNVISDVSPFIEKDRTLVPIRVISENLGYEVGWDNKTRKVTVKNKDKTIELVVGKKDVKFDDKVSTIDVPPMIKSERTFVPLRFISESFDNDVDWDNDTRTVKIKKKEDKVASIFDDKKSSSIIYTNPIAKDEKEQDKNRNISNNWSRPQDSSMSLETRKTSVPQYRVNNDFESSKIYFQSGKNYSELKNTTKFKKEKLEHIERLLRQLDMTLKNGSTLNYNVEKETQNLKIIQEKHRTNHYGNSTSEKIRYLDDCYNIWISKNQLNFHTEFRQFSQKHYYQMLYYYDQIKDFKEESKIEDYTIKCEKIYNEFENGKNERQCNNYLYEDLKKRQYISQKIDLLYFDGADLHRNEIFDLNKKLIFIDSNIMYERKPDTEFTMYPYVKSLLDEYDIGVKKDIENYYIPNN